MIGASIILELPAVQPATVQRGPTAIFCNERLYALWPRTAGGRQIWWGRGIRVETRFAPWGPNRYNTDFWKDKFRVEKIHAVHQANRSRLPFSSPVFFPAGVSSSCTQDEAACKVSERRPQPVGLEAHSSAGAFVRKKRHDLRAQSVTRRNQNGLNPDRTSMSARACASMAGGRAAELMGR